MKSVIEKFINKGFKYAWVAQDGHDLNTALTFRQVTTCESQAKKHANAVLIKDRSVKVWQLEKELLNLDK